MNEERIIYEASADPYGRSSLLWMFRTPSHEWYLPHLQHVRGHRDWSPDLNHNGIIEANERIKECPCFEVGQFLSDHGLAEWRITR